jgi:hypothetical protein
MLERYREADANRFVLLAQIRTGGTRERMRSALGDDAGPGADFSRMEERVNQDAFYVDALEDLDDDSPPPPPSRPSAAEMDERLRELKRKMGKD